MKGKGELLFCKYDLRAALESQEKKIFEEIDGIDGNRLLNTSVEDLCDYFEEKYKIHAPQIKEEAITVDQQEADVDISQDYNRFIIDRGRSFHIKGTAITFCVPFEGDQELFKCRASTSTVAPPRAAIHSGELNLTHITTDHDVKTVRQQFDRELASIKEYLGWIKNDIAPFNSSIRAKAKSRVEARREKLLKDQNLVAGLGFPLKRRNNAPQTYVVPTVRKASPVRRIADSTQPYVAEPTLDMQEYEHILSVITNMVKVMERSPHAFLGMKEEDLRQHFLVQLNGQYEGQATGETFNFDGKTDILIRVGDKNIFIAECKFWKGTDSLKAALEQLLNYATWRDTKVALLIFNRDREFSTVLKKIPETIMSYPNFKRELVYNSEIGFRFILHHRDDSNRELILTVLAFEVPA